MNKQARVRGGGKEGVVAEAEAAKARLAHLLLHLKERFSTTDSPSFAVLVDR